MPHLGQSPSDSTSPLRPEVEREVFLVLVVLSQILSRLVVHHSQDPCDRLAHDVAVKQGHWDRNQTKVHDRNVHLGEFRRGAPGGLLYPEGEQLILEFRKLFGQVTFGPVREDRIRM